MTQNRIQKRNEMLMLCCHTQKNLNAERLEQLKIPLGVNREKQKKEFEKQIKRNQDYNWRRREAIWSSGACSELKFVAHGDVKQLKLHQHNRRVRAVVTWPMCVGAIIIIQASSPAKNAEKRKPSKHSAKAKASVKRKPKIYHVINFFFFIIFIEEKFDFLKENFSHEWSWKWKIKTVKNWRAKRIGIGLGYREMKKTVTHTIESWISHY